MRHLLPLAALLTAAIAPLTASAAPAASETPANSPALTERKETAAQHDARMAWFRDARFGMFIHWGLYSQAAGFWNGKSTKTNHCAEWLQIAGRVPVADYAKLAKDFNPVKYDADAWVRAAKAAGMKYIVITTKHHEGFAMFKTKASPFNIIDATPYKKDAIKALADACRKHGMKLGFYYSQNLDWHHAGGGGGTWDPAQKGDAGAYVDKIVIPQLDEILSNYGEVAMLWFDIPGGAINQERANRIWKLVTTKQPKIIVNNRLGGGYHGDIETPENFIPPAGFPGKDWESCMTMNRTWGFAKDDHEWKSTQTLIRNLADIASKGGNLLLNVGPTGQGEIPAPSLERLAEVAGWMKVNAEAIHGTRSAGFAALPEWGRFTQRRNADGTTTLYAIVYDAPKSGEVVISGLANPLVTARALGLSQPVVAKTDGASIRVTLPASLQGKQDFVLALTLKGDLRVDNAAYPDSAGAFRLTPRQAECTKGLKEEITGSSGVDHSPPEAHLGYWTDAGATATWTIKAPTAGEYTLTARVGAPDKSAGSVLEFVSGNTVLPLEIKATGGWNNYRDMPVGTVKLPAGESKLIVRVKTRQGEAPCNFAGITLAPAK